MASTRPVNPPKVKQKMKLPRRSRRTSFRDVSERAPLHAKILTAVGMPMTRVPAEKYTRARSDIPTVNI